MNDGVDYVGSDDEELCCSCNIKMDDFLGDEFC